MRKFKTGDVVYATAFEEGPIGIVIGYFSNRLYIGHYNGAQTIWKRDDYITLASDLTDLEKALYGVEDVKS